MRENLLTASKPSRLARCRLALVAATAGAAAVALVATRPADSHVVRPTCNNAVTSQHKTFVGYANRVYRAPHGCVWLQPWTPRARRDVPPEVRVRVHRTIRRLAPTLPERLLHPEFSGFCGASNFAVQWPYVFFTVPQRVPAGAGRWVCDHDLLLMGQVSQYATRATWRVFRSDG